MPEQPRPPIKNCPACGITMLAGKADDSLIDCDTFTCPNCRMVVSYERRRRDPTGNRKSETRNQKP
jgi:ssDNA-binding Zn-finger/Zn-ribbon topoisomerase 1